MKRNEWIFSYTVSKILEAAVAKVEWHKGRVEFWTDAKKQVLEKVKADGIEVDESLAKRIGSSSNDYNSINRGTTISIRDDYAADLREAVSKIKEHQYDLSGYAAWVDILTAADQHEFMSLQHDDWLYFFGK